MNQQQVIQTLEEITMIGTDNWKQWVQEHPDKASEVLKAHFQLFLTEIIEDRIFEYED